MALQTSLELNQINADDKRFQIRQDKTLDKDNIISLVHSDSDQWPPIKIVERDGRFIIVGGHHRFEAAKQLKLSAIKVEILDASLSDSKLLLEAYADNRANAKQLTLAERKAHALAIYLDNPALAHYRIAAMSGIQDKTVSACIKAHNKSEHEKAMANKKKEEKDQQQELESFDPDQFIMPEVYQEEITGEESNKIIEEAHIKDLERSAKAFKRALSELSKNDDSDFTSIIGAIMKDSIEHKRILVGLSEVVTVLN